MKFKIKASALGTRDFPGAGFEDILFGLTDYVETAVEYNNDYLVGPWIKGKKIITRIHDVDSDFLLGCHLKYLGVSGVEILLLDMTAIEQSWPDIKKFPAAHVGVTGTGITKESLKVWHEHYGSWPSYVSIPLNPYNFRKDLMDFLKETGIGVISYEIFGGPLQAPRLLRTFGLQFLTRFASYYSDIVCMSSAANLKDEVVLSRTLDDLIREEDIDDQTVYDLKSDSIKPDPGVTRKIHNYSVVSISGQNHTFRNDDPGYLGPGELLMSPNPRAESIPVLNLTELSEADNILVETYTIMSEILELPGPAWKEEVSAYYRYIVVGSLKNFWPGPRYKMKLSGSTGILRITVTDRLKFWAKSHEYVLYVSDRLDGGYNVFFRNL